MTASYKWTTEQNNVFLGAATTVNIGNTNAVVAPGPFAVGDTLIASLLLATSGQTVTPPSGWNLIGQATDTASHQILFYYKIAGGSETGSYTFSWGTSSFFVWTLTSYQGASVTTPVDASSVTAFVSGASGNVTTGTISPTGSHDTFILLPINGHGDPITMPGGMTAQVPSTLMQSSTTTYAVSDLVLSSSGATAAQTFQAGSTASNPGAYLLLALAPAGAAAAKTVAPPAPSPLLPFAFMRERASGLLEPVKGLWRPKRELILQ